MDKKQINSGDPVVIKPDSSLNHTVEAENIAAQNIVNLPEQPARPELTEKAVPINAIGYLAIENCENYVLGSQPTVEQPQFTEEVRLSDIGNSSPQKLITLPLPNRLFNKRVLFVGLAAFLSIFIAGSLYMFAKPDHKPGTFDSQITIGGVDVSQKSIETASADLKKIAESQKITLTIKDKTLEATAPEIGISRNISESVNNAAATKRSLAEKIGLKKKEMVKFEVKTSVNKEKLNAFIGAKMGNDLLARDAQLVLEGENFVVKPGQKGLFIDLDQLISEMNKTDLTAQPKITAKVVMVEPSITDATAEEAKNKANDIISPTYTIGHPSIGNKLLGMNLKTTWVVISPNPAKNVIDISLDKKAVQRDVEFLAKTFNKTGRERIKVNIPGQQVILIDDGADGINIPNEEIAKVKNEILAKLDQKQPLEAIVNPSLQPRAEKYYDGQQKMVLVDMPHFRAYAVENGQTIRGVPITTGKRGFETPTGTYVINRKVPISTMSACSRGECWSVPNIKWQSFFTNQGHAIHASAAPGAVGNYNISHGCIGMYEADARFFYDWAVSGTPVVIVR